MSDRVFMIISVVDCIYEWVVVWLVSRIGGRVNVARWIGGLMWGGFGL